MREVLDVGWMHFSGYTFSPAVRAGDHLYISGMTASSDDGKIVSPGDIVGQTRFIFLKAQHVLGAAGGSMADVVMTRDYFTTTDGYAGTADVRREFFGETFPAATGVKVAGLLRRDALIEIEFVAVLTS
ncbi:MAG: RidA family protein [Solirubrobacteraceae bacterium]